VPDVCVLIFVETFQMGKIHKDIAMFMVDAAKNEEYNDQKLVKVILLYAVRLQTENVLRISVCSTVYFQKK